MLTRLARALVLLVSEEGSATIDAVAVSCAANGVLNNLYTVDEDVPIDGGAFTAKSSDVDIAGSFTSADRADGTVKGLTDGAVQCGIPEQGSWTADRVMTVEVKPAEKGSGGAVLGNSFTTSDQGSTFSYVSIAKQDGSQVSGTADGGGA